MAMRARCWDDRTATWWGLHQWLETGQCARCGAWQPGISHEARREMDEQAQRRRDERQGKGN